MQKWKANKGSCMRASKAFGSRRRKSATGKIVKRDWSYVKKHEIKNPDTIDGVPVNVLNRMNMTLEQGLAFWEKYKTKELERTFRNRPDLHPYVDILVRLKNEGYLDTYIPLMGEFKRACDRYRKDHPEHQTPKPKRDRRQF